MYWVIRKFTGGTEESLITRITLPIQNTIEKNKEVGPVSLSLKYQNILYLKLKLKI